MKRIVGLIGKIASGKTVVAEYLVREKDASYYRFSDILRDVLERIHIENTRENLQRLGLTLRESFGDGLLAEALKKDIIGDESSWIVVDGIRYRDEYDMVKELGGVLVYVHCPEKLRYERVTGRATRGESGISFEQFRQSEEAETESLIESLGESADYRLDNTGSLAELDEKISNLVSEFT